MTIKKKRAIKKEFNYVVVGDNNYWYSTITCAPDELEKEMNELIQDITDGNYTDDTSSLETVSELRAYKVGEPKTYYLDEEE